MPATLQLELPCGIDDLLAEVRSTGILPVESVTAGLSGDEKTSLCRAWMDGMSAQAERAGKAFRAQFKARGWAFKWFSEWRPTTAKDEALSEAIDEALEVVAQYYPAILSRGIDEAEDMGILQSKGRGSSEGIQAKREAYGQMILISVHCVTGPTNFDPSTGGVEFEPGSRSHALHLAYMELPSMERLAGDIAAYPLITAEGNRSFSRPGILNKWGSEGWTGEDATRPRLHQPWDTLKAAPALAA